ncbi:MAG: Cell wall surface anchor family protein, partial [Candidatus Shapirobacteria bacterium GW2011_GWE2_38_30]
STLSLSGTNVSSSALELNYLDGTTVTTGGVIYTDGTKLANTGVGVSGQVLMSNGAAIPTWMTLPGATSYSAGIGLSLTPANVFNLTDTGVTAATYGAGTSIPIFTVDAQGRITSASSVLANFESPLTFTNGLTRTDNTIGLGGTLTQLTKIDLNSYNFGFFGVGNVGIGTTNPTSPLSTYVNSTSVVNTGVLIEQDGTGDAAMTFLLTGTQNWSLGIDNSNSDVFQISNGANLANNAYLSITTAGNVGIGTTAPTAKLEIFGIASETIATRNHLAFSNINDVFIQMGLDADGDLAIDNVYGTDANIMTIKRTGNVGIGTTNPTQKLDVIGAANISIGITTPKITLTTGASNGFILQSDASGNASWVSGSGTGTIGLGGTLSQLTKIDLNSNNFGFFGTGNVGIGTTNPTQKLEVNGNITGNKFIDNSSVGSTHFFLDLAQSDPSHSSANFTYSGSIRFNVNDTDATYLENNYTASKIQNFANGLSLSVGTTNIAGATITWNTGLFLNTSGNVGIGTTAPTAILDVVGGEIRVAASQSGQNSGYFAYLRANHAEQVLDIGVSSNSVIKSYGYYNTSALALLTSNTERMRIDANGNVGIGTTAPAAKLDVNGNLYVSSIGTSSDTAINIRGPNQPTNYASFKDISYSFDSAGSARIRGSRGGGWNTNLDFLVTDTSATLQTLIHLNGQYGRVGIGTTAPLSAGLHIDIGSTNTTNWWLDGGNNMIITNPTGDSAIKLASQNSHITFGNGTTGDFLTIGSRDSAGSATEMLYMDNNGNVGIGGTPAAGRKLHVYGTLSAGYDSGGLSTFFAYQSEDGDTGMARVNNGNNFGLLMLGLANTPHIGGYDGGRLYISGFSSTGSTAPAPLATFEFSTGNVGIGTTNPAGKLEVRSSGYATYIFTDSSTSSYSTTFNMDNVGLDIGHNSASRSLNLKTSSTDRLTILGNGNVGIGTTAPTYKLDVIGNGRITGVIGVGATPNSSYAINAAGGTYGIWAEGSTMGGRFVDSSGTSTTYAAWGDWGIYTGQDGYFGGNVGIGTTNAAGYKLNVNGEIFSSTKIGIGATHATYELYVTGDGYFSNSLSVGTSLYVGTTLSVGADISITTAAFLGKAADTALLPSFSWETDTNNGMFRRTTDVVGFSTAGVERLTILANGKVGIGASTPTALLNLRSGTAAVSIDHTQTASLSQLAFTEVGTTSFGGINLIGSAYSSTYAYRRNDLEIVNSAPTGDITFWTNSTQRASLSSIGYLGIGTTNAGYHLQVNNGTSVGSYTTTGWTHVSDVRLKKNITTLTDSLSKILQIRGTRFDYISEPDAGGIHIGFIAQELEQIVPEMVVTDPESGYKSVAYGNLEPVLVEAIQEQQDQINSLGANLTISQTGQISIGTSLSPDVLSSMGLTDAKSTLTASDYYLTDTLGQIVNQLADFSEIAAARIQSGLINTYNLIAQNAVIDNLRAGKTSTNELKTDLISPLSEVTDTIVVDGNLDIAGTLTADAVNTNSIGASQATFDTVYANNIISKDGSFGQIMSDKISALRTEVRDLLASAASSSAATSEAIADAQTASQAWYTSIEADSATIHGNLSLTDDMVIGADLTVHGQTQLGSAFITGTFTAGEIAIQNNYIETTNTALYIQPSGLGSVHILNDILVVSESGDVVITGNLSIDGKLAANEATISGDLFANVITATDASISGTLTANNVESNTLLSDRINIATDSTTIIAEGGFAQLATSSAKLATNATAGTATLPAGKTEIVIYNDKITSSSMVYLTPAGSTQNQVIYLKDKYISPTPAPTATPESYFVIALDHPLTAPLDINWWIIN